VAGRLRIGTSGYEYPHWRGVLYPEGLPRRRWLEHYAQAFDCVEINNTFYHLPEAATFDAWRERAPRGFRYALKFSRYGSHLKRLRAPRDTIGRFLERAERLKSFLGPILVQLPPRWHADPERLDAFLRRAPRRHRWAVEPRDPSWLAPAVLRVLERRGAALVLHDLLPRMPHRATAGFVYLRFHGVEDGGRYAHQALSAHARRIRGWLAGGRDVWAFFNNDRGGHSVRDARRLRRYVLGP